MIDKSQITNPAWLAAIRKAEDSRPSPTSPSASRRSKYRAVPVVIDGQRFASTKEGERYRTLCRLKSAGEVLWFAVQARFVIEGGAYVCDFIVHWADGRTSVEDVKGFRTPEYRRKRKQMKQRWGIEIEEV